MSPHSYGAEGAVSQHSGVSQRCPETASTEPVHGVREGTVTLCGSSLGPMPHMPVLCRDEDGAPMGRCRLSPPGRLEGHSCSTRCLWVVTPKATPRPAAPGQLWGRRMLCPQPLGSQPGAEAGLSPRGLETQVPAFLPGAESRAIALSVSHLTPLLTSAMQGNALCLPPVP